jgi:hypothetical protein
VNRKSSKVLFIESLSYATLIIAFLFRLVGIDVVIFKSDSISIRGKKTLLNALGMKMVSFPDLLKIDPSVIDGDVQDRITECVDSIFPGYNFFDFFQELFPGVDEVSRKLRIFSRQYVGYNFFDSMSMIHWLENSEYSNNTIISIVSLTPGARYLWKCSNLNSFNMLPPGWWLVQQFILFSKSLFRKLLSRILNRIISGSRQRDTFNENKCGLNGDAEVVYFPHMSIFCGNSYVKDNFYSDDPMSPFHASHIQHIEYDKRANISSDRERAREYMRIDSIQYESLPSVSYKNFISSVVYFFLFICRNIRGFFSLEGANLSSIVGVAGLYLLYRKYFLATSSLKKTKIALVGYDILFPKGLSLALETHGIRTVAIQERIGAPFVNNLSYILDTQLTISSYVDTFIESKRNCFFIKSCIPVGQIRTDHFFDKYKQNSSGAFSYKVVVLDYHVDPDPWMQMRTPIVNWANDRSFREEVLRLADKYPNVAFVFRGKNDAWVRNDYFQDIVQRVDRSKNVRVDRNYKTWNHSYHICSEADLIIAKPTSLAEECMSMGYDVLVADYGTNYSRGISVFFPYSDRGNYCHSFVELERKFVFFMEHGYVVEPSEMKRMIDELFDGLTDGNVQARVQHHLHLMLERDRSKKG